MLALRFYGNRTQAEIAAELGISQMHVSRLLGRALSWMREAMLSDVPPRFEGGPVTDRSGMTVSVVRTGAALTVRVTGEVDRDTAARLHVGLRQAVRRATAAGVVVDLSGVPLMDAAGVGVLVAVAAAAATAEVPFGLTGARPYVARILAVSGLAGVLD
jgi:RNA polymerase sigma-B factor